MPLCASSHGTPLALFTKKPTDKTMRPARVSLAPTSRYSRQKRVDPHRQTILGLFVGIRLVLSLPALPRRAMLFKRRLSRFAGREYNRAQRKRQSAYGHRSYWVIERAVQQFVESLV